MKKKYFISCRQDIFATLLVTGDMQGVEIPLDLQLRQCSKIEYIIYVFNHWLDKIFKEKNMQPDDEISDNDGTTTPDPVPPAEDTADEIDINSGF